MYVILVKEMEYGGEIIVRKVIGPFWSEEDSDRYLSYLPKDEQVWSESVKADAP